MNTNNTADIFLFIALLVATNATTACTQLLNKTTKCSPTNESCQHEASIINLKNGQTLHGELLLDIRFLRRFANHGAAEHDTAKIFVDGELAGSGEEGRPAGTGYATFLPLPTDAYANGWHLVSVSLGNAPQAEYRIKFINDISHISIDGLANPVASIAARNETSKSWTVEIWTTNAPAVKVRTFHGNGKDVHASWDGKDTKGKSVPDDSYLVMIAAGKAKPHLEIVNKVSGM